MVSASGRRGLPYRFEPVNGTVRPTYGAGSTDFAFFVLVTARNRWYLSGLEGVPGASPSAGFWLSSGMFHSVLCVVLSLLMLMPPGICICGGGAQPCQNHPDDAAVLGAESLETAVDPCCSSVPAADQTQFVGRHQCPSPLPHQSSCPVVAPATDQASPENVQPHTPDLLAVAVVVYLPHLTFPRPTAPASVPVSKPPLFIAHCALLI